MINSNLTKQANWSLDEVNSLQSSFRIGGISPSTAVSIGINNAVDYMQVVYIPWDGPYPTQLITTVAGKKEMYIRHCVNGEWDAPQKVITSSNIVEGKAGTFTSSLSAGTSYTYEVVFNTPFADKNYTISIAPNTSNLTYYVSAWSTTGFSVSVYANNETAGATFSWSAAKWPHFQ